MLEQIKRIEKEREEQQLKSATIVMQKPGESPVPLSQQQILDMIQQQQKTIKEQHSLIEKLQQGAVLFANQNGEQISLNHSQILEQIKQMHIIIEGLKKEMLEKDNIIQNLQKQLVHAKLTGKTIVNKSEPEFPVVL